MWNKQRMWSKRRVYKFCWILQLWMRAQLHWKWNLLYVLWLRKPPMQKQWKPNMGIGWTILSVKNQMLHWWVLNDILFRKPNSANYYRYRRAMIAMSTIGGIVLVIFVLALVIRIGVWTWNTLINLFRFFSNNFTVQFLLYNNSYQFIWKLM